MPNLAKDPSVLPECQVSRVDSRIAPGQRVRVKSGELTGVEGEVVSQRRENRLLVAVRFLQRTVSIMIQDFQVEPI